VNDPERPEQDPEVLPAEILDDDGRGGPAGATGPGDLLGGGAGFDLGSMMQMAAEVQTQVAEAQERLAASQVVGSAGGGLVTVTLNGHLHLVGIHIDPSAPDPEDPSMLEDLVRAAWQDAHDQVAQLQAQTDPLGGLGGFGGLGDLLGGG
jgi:DNA-binding YbaB/EbfC family protein